MQATIGIEQIPSFALEMAMTLQTNAFIIVTRQSMQLTSKSDLTLQTCLLLATNVFFAGDKHFRRWRRMHYILEMNTLALETNALKTSVQTSVTHKHTDSQRLPNKIYSEMIASHSSPLLKMSATCTTGGDPKGTCIQLHNSIFCCTKLVFKAEEIKNWWQANLLQPVTPASSRPGVA